MKTEAQSYARTPTDSIDPDDVRVSAGTQECPAACKDYIEAFVLIDPKERHPELRQWHTVLRGFLANVVEVSFTENSNISLSVESDK